MSIVMLGACAVAMAQEPLAPPGKGTVAENARRVLETKCAECHGPAVLKPKGGFGYVTDLAALASDPALVVPGQPGKSAVYLRLMTADLKERMPPGKAKGGGLSQEEVEFIRAWISAGAPSSLRSVGESPGSHAGEPSPEHYNASSVSGIGRLLRWLGKFHPVVVHFPIALLLCAVLAELLGGVLKRREFEAVVLFCLVLGSTGALAAAALGWLAADAESTSGGTLSLHRWLGVSAALLSAGTVAARISARRTSTTFRPWYLLLLVSTGFLTAVAGHYGAMLVHGRDHFSW